MRIMQFCLGVLIVASVVLVAQEQRPSQADAATAVNIELLSRDLRSEADVPDDDLLTLLTNRVRSEVHRFVENAIFPSTTSQSAQVRLRAVLAGHRPEPDFGDLPFARVMDLRYGRSLVAAYTLVRGPHHDLGTIAGFVADGGRFRLFATAGDDFVGYNMLKAELRPPAAGEFWLMVWGQAHAFNGKRVRFRVYAFDGVEFRTVWSPEDILDATLRVTGDGFIVDHIVGDPSRDGHDQYLLTVNGPVKTN